MSLMIALYTKERIDDAIDFERRLRLEEEYGWEIDGNYRRAIEDSFHDPRFEALFRFLLMKMDLSSVASMQQGFSVDLTGLPTRLISIGSA